jgi:hypothetical protein
MNHLALTMVVIFGGLFSGAALAQNTIGELLAAGGKQLSKDEVLATLRGASVSGLTAAGGRHSATGRRMVQYPDTSLTQLDVGVASWALGWWTTPAKCVATSQSAFTRARRLKIAL